MLRTRFQVAALLRFALVIAYASSSPGGGRNSHRLVQQHVRLLPGHDDQNGGPFGAICKYENGGYDLDWIKVRAPARCTATIRQDQGRLALQHPAQERQWRQLDDASTTARSRPAWQGRMTRPRQPRLHQPDVDRAQPNPTGWFKVRILLWWVNPSGTGKMKVEYDWYQGKWNGNTDQRDDYCLQDCRHRRRTLRTEGPAGNGRALFHARITFPRPAMPRAGANGEPP